MAKTKSKSSSSKSLKFIPFSEIQLVIFAMVFSAIGSYSILRSLALTEDATYPVRATAASEEASWFSGVLGATSILVAAGPIAVFIYWWLWRRSELMTWIKLSLTLAPICIIMAFT